MDFNKTITTAFFTLCLACLFACREKSEVIVDEVLNSDASPNIVLIIADDLGWDAFGNYPGITSTKARTPTLDSMAKAGLTFTNFWASPECAPTRASLLTGKYSFRTGVGGVQTPQTATLTADEVILQKYIEQKNAGKYGSAVIGKWHVSGNSPLNAPESLGVPYFSGIMRDGVSDYYNWTQTSGGQEQTITTYTTTHFVNQSINWIKQQQKPFFLWLAFNAPHTPFHRPPLNLIKDQSLADNAAEIRSNPLPYYLAAVEAMDTEIARLLASMSMSQRENTVFIFMGDNGTPGQVAQSPFSSRMAKGTLYQGGINTPLIVCGKGVSRKNAIENSIVQAPDLFATIAGIAGTGTVSYEDGVSLKYLFTESNVKPRAFVYSELFDSTIPTNDGYAIRNEGYSLIQLKNGDEYFYNLKTDSFETGV